MLCIYCVLKWLDIMFCLRLWDVFVSLFLYFVWIPTLLYLQFIYFLLILPFLKPQSPTLSSSLLNVKKEVNVPFPIKSIQNTNIYLYVNLTLFWMLVRLVVCVCRKIVQNNKKKRFDFNEQIEHNSRTNTHNHAFINVSNWWVIPND